MEEVCIINYGLGNVQSLKNALIKCIVTNQLLQLIIIYYKIQRLSCQVMSFWIYEKLNQLNLDKTIKSLVRENKKIIAICLGMQLLLETSEEAENIAGLGIFQKEKSKDSSKEALPHVSWKKIYSKEEILELRNLFTKYYFIQSIIVM